MDYKGIKCPVCDKPFTENDDIVVCPVCGAPYHRGCYKEKGACIFTDLHESGKTWAPPVPPDAPNTAITPASGSASVRSRIGVFSP